MTAEVHLYKTLLKIKSVSSDPVLPQYVHDFVDSSRRQLDGASANVQARLFKSAPVQEFMTKALDDVRALLGLDEVKAEKRKRLRAKDYQYGDSDGNTSLHTVPRSKAVSVSASQSDDAVIGAPDRFKERLQLEDEGGEPSEEDYDMYASRLAASSDEDDNNDFPKDEDSREGELDPESITEDDAYDTEMLDEMKQKPKAHKPPKKPPSATPKSTTFLPSLSMGYFSGSESAEGLSDEGPQERKNRMGQQARRALWEKKFGKNANHVKKQLPDRDQGWDARRGASAADDRGERGRGRGRGDMARGKDKPRSGRGPMSSGANSDPVLLKKAKPAGNALLHPSWEAAKKAKEQKKLAHFQGKKLVFD